MSSAIAIKIAIKKQKNFHNDIFQNFTIQTSYDNFLSKDNPVSQIVTQTLIPCNKVVGLAEA